MPEKDEPLDDEIRLLPEDYEITEKFEMVTSPKIQSSVSCFHLSVRKSSLIAGCYG